MSTYTQRYTRPYTDGYKDRPDESTPEYARFINARDDALIRIEAFLAALQIPEKLSELVNDEGFIKNTVSNLANYYLKTETYARTETYTQSEVQALIADAVSKVSGKLNISVVDALPTSDISTTTFYLVPKETAQEKNLYDEYINTDGTESGWELIGAVSTGIELSEYYKKSEVDALLEVKMNKADIVPSKFEGTKAVVGNQVPSGGGSDMHNYSTEEQLTGKKWLNGKPIYQKTIEFSFVGGSTVNVDIADNIEYLLCTYGFAFNSKYMYTISMYTQGQGGQFLYVFENPNKLRIRNTNPDFDKSSGYVTVLYTKTTDTATA